MFTNLEKVLNDPVVKLVQEVGFTRAAELMKNPEGKSWTVDEVREHVVNLQGEADFEFFAKQRLFVEDDTLSEDKIVPFQLNGAQKKLLYAIEKQKSLGVPVRIAHLKPRQYGASTFFSGYIFRDLMNRRNRHATTISYVLDSADHIRGIAGRFHDRYVGRKKRHELTNRSAKLWKFPHLDNTWRIDSAENIQAGHSFTNQILHLSEISRWPGDVRALMRGLTSSVQALPDTMTFVESTANGYGDYFYELWYSPKSGYEKVFVAWFEIEKYRMPFHNDRMYDGVTTKAEFERKLQSDEKHLMDAYGVSLEQLHWRRWKIDVDLKEEEDFHEQYPSNPEEAFLTSGRPYFKMEVVRANLRRTEKLTPKIGELERVGESVEFIEDSAGLWKIMKFPESGWEARYVTGTDTSEGIAADKENKDPDYTSITVLDRYKNEEVARFYGRVDEDVVADEIRKVTKFYGGSTCDCIERSSSGIAVIALLKHDDEITLYQKELLAKTEDGETAEYGFRTLKDTRDVLVSELRTRIRLGQYKSSDHDFWKDCSTFVFDKAGKPQGMPGTHDDRVMSAALAIQASLQAAETTPITPIHEEVFNPDLDVPRPSERFVKYVEF